MLIRLTREYLRPYTRPLVGVVVLQLIGTIASLYLPRLNADIIDLGIARGDTGYIMRTGGWMLLVSALQITCSIVAVYLARADGDGLRPRRTGGGLRPGDELLRPRGQPVRRAVADHAQHQ